MSIGALEPTTTTPQMVEGGISEDELTALALACPADQPLDPAASVDQVLLRRGTLPLAYMPPAAPGRHSRWFMVVALLLIAAFLTITGFGFCISYGTLSFA